MINQGPDEDSGFRREPPSAKEIHRRREPVRLHTEIKAEGGRVATDRWIGFGDSARALPSIYKEKLKRRSAPNALQAEPPSSATFSSSKPVHRCSP